MVIVSLGQLICKVVTRVIPEEILNWNHIIGTIILIISIFLFVKKNWDCLFVNYTVGINKLTKKILFFSIGYFFLSYCIHSKRMWFDLSFIVLFKTIGVLLVIFFISLYLFSYLTNSAKKSLRKG